MMATIFNSSIFNSAILDSAILHKTLTQTSSIWLKLIHSDPTWWWQPSWILPLWIQLFCTKKKTSLIHLTQLYDGSHLEFCPLDSDTAILDSDDLLSSLRFTQNTLPQLWTWLKLIPSDDGSHLEFDHLGFSDVSFFSQTHSHLPRLVPTIFTKKTSLIYSDWTWWWQLSWILPCWIQTLPS